MLRKKEFCEKYGMSDRGPFSSNVLSQPLFVQ